MIAGLRGIGIPAGYVSGFLRTIPPPGSRAAGRRRRHARLGAGLVRAQAGWVEYDPTNRIFAGESHIVVAVGRDYQDISPIAGILSTTGTQKTSQKVDVVPVDPAAGGA